MTPHLEQLKLTIRDAWRTLAMLPDPDARFRRAFRGWTLPTIRSVKDGDFPSGGNMRPIPSPTEITIMEKVLDWLTWLRMVAPPDGGDLAIKRLAAWGMGRPVWSIAQREHCSERTIHYRISRCVKKIGMQFKEEISEIIPHFSLAGVRIEPVNEPEPRPDRIRGFGDKANADAPETLEPGRLYVDGVGMMFHGEKYRSPMDYEAKSVGKRRR